MFFDLQAAAWYCNTSCSFINRFKITCMKKLFISANHRMAVILNLFG
jgi:hypothetical protein